MSILIVFLILAAASIAFLGFSPGEKEIRQPNGTVVLKPGVFIQQEMVDLLVILAIIIFGIWGILISLGVYNF